MKWLIQQLDIYGSVHTKLVTKITHFVGVPLVIFSLLIALAWFKFSFPPLFSTNFAWLSIVFIGIFYLYIDWRLGLVLLLSLVLMAWVASILAKPDFSVSSFILFAALFIAGWAVQFIGHCFEGNKPAFLSNMAQFFIAPLFLVAEAAVMMGWRKDLHEVIQSHTELML